MRYKTIIDISLPIREGMITYPKNPEVSIDRVSTGTSFLSSLSLGSHTGTHIDVPGHVFEGAPGVEQVDFQKLIGPCRVLDMAHVAEYVGIKDLEKADIQEGERILVRTSNSDRGFTEFYEDYVYLDGDAADYLVEKKIALFGIDSLSVKKRGGADQRPHTSLLKADVIIVEGLDLSKPEPGAYDLICLPLRLDIPDGAPARAVLLKAA